MSTFNLKSFIIETIINGYATGQWSRERAAIMSTNYMLKGVLDTDDLEYIAMTTAAPDEPEISEEAPTEVEPEETETEE